MFETPFVLQVKRYEAEVSKDSHGNAVSGYADPVDWPVHSIVPGAMVEPGDANRDLSLIAYTVLAPVDELLPGERDLVVLDGVDYPVNGHPGDFSRAAPWAPDTLATATVELQRVEG